MLRLFASGCGRQVGDDVNVDSKISSFGNLDVLATGYSSTE